jgi:HlyD family secretion protein
VLLESRRQALAGKKAQLKERVTQLGQEIAGLVAQENAKEREIRLIAKELEGLIELQKKDLVPSIKVMSLQRDAARLEGERGQLIAASAQAKGRIAEIELQLLQLDQDLKADVIKELREIEAKQSELAERRVAAEDQLKRVEIRSPQSGIVHQLAVHTVGGVVSPSEPMMLIVPRGDVLVIEAKIAPHDIDNVQVGQKAIVRFPGFNAKTTPEIDGEVARVAADLTKDPQFNQAYYVARIALPPDALAKLKSLKLLPGMPAEVHVQSGVRTMVSYLMKPLTDQYARAFTEQ